MEFPEGRGGSILGADFGKSRGGEGLYEKSLPWGGGYGYFLEPHNITFPLSSKICNVDVIWNNLASTHSNSRGSL